MFEYLLALMRESGCVPIECIQRRMGPQCRFHLEAASRARSVDAGVRSHSDSWQPSFFHPA
jgi:hypothetical protein